MSKMKKLINYRTESKVKVEDKISSREVVNRMADAKKNIDKMKFAKKYSHSPFEKYIFKIDDKEHIIQVNFCINPFCKWFGLEQNKYENIKNKPSRYRIIGEFNKKKLSCMDVEDDSISGHICKDYGTLYSNWAVSSEIKRLIDINTITAITPDYKFHKEGCSHYNSTPFNNRKDFHKKGESTSGSPKYKCKYCGKMTNILPKQEKSFNYNQKRNDILPKLMGEILGHSPVTKSIERLGIGAGTYYRKVELLYKRCLEFLERHETIPLKNKRFNTLWLQTDKFSYYLNNIRRKGCASIDGIKEDPVFQTFIIATADGYSNYIFRSDLAYDFNITTNKLSMDQLIYNDNSVYAYAQKNPQYRYSDYGSKDQPKDMINERIIENIMSRGNYVDGFHVNSTYTAYAQYWLINKMLNVNNLNYVTDEDKSLIGAIMRANVQGVKDKTVNVYTCKVDKSLSKTEARKLCFDYKKQIAASVKKSIKIITPKDVAIEQLAKSLSVNGLYKRIVESNGNTYTEKRKVELEHPAPYMDEGRRFIDCCTDLSHLTDEEMAKQLYNVNMRAVNTYFNQIRRSINTLERPISTSRGEGRSYIYANYNPKYAHQLTTILRTYLNFCKPIKRGEGKYTPAMTLGIAKKIFDVKDIVYFK